jgi:hypothetical protein
MFHICALVDPATSVVWYIGQTTQEPALRYRPRCGGNDPTNGGWVRRLSAPPNPAILASGEECRVVVGAKGKRTPRAITVSVAARAGVKWVKRFRRTVLNRHTRNVCAVVWDGLTNPDETGPLEATPAARRGLGGSHE